MKRQVDSSSRFDHFSYKTALAEDECAMREFTRIKSSRQAEIDFARKKYGPNRIKDMSLTGMFIDGVFDHSVGEECTVSYSRTFGDFSFSFTARAKIARTTDQGLGITFVSMDLDSYMMLQTTLLYDADNPFPIGLELPQNSPYNVFIPGEKNLKKAVSKPSLMNVSLNYNPEFQEK